MNIENLNEILRDQLDAHRRLMEESGDIIIGVASALLSCIRDGGKILLFGNGGSAADAQHVAAEIVGRFKRERRGLPAIALTTDTSILTAIGNDYGFEQIFARQIEALTKPGDVAVGISTSGNSANVLRALELAREMGAKTIGFTGGKGGRLPALCDICFIAPVDDTARIQELHISAWHAICDLVERELTGGD